MTTDRSALGLIRRVHHRALRVLPSQAAPGEIPEHRELTELGRAVIDGRTVTFGTQARRPRLWVTEGEAPPRVIGHLTGLVLGEPDLWICDTEAWEWVNGGEVAARLKAAASRVWDDCVRTCDG